MNIKADSDVSRQLAANAAAAGSSVGVGGSFVISVYNDSTVSRLGRSVHAKNVNVNTTAKNTAKSTARASANGAAPSGSSASGNSDGSGDGSGDSDQGGDQGSESDSKTGVDEQTDGMLGGAGRLSGHVGGGGVNPSQTR